MKLIIKNKSMSFSEAEHTFDPAMDTVHAAVLVLAVATGNSLAEPHLATNNCLVKLGKMLALTISDKGFDSVISQDSYINIYSKFGNINHAVFVSQLITQDPDVQDFVGGDYEHEVTYRCGTRVMDLKLDLKKDTATLFQMLQAQSPQPPMPRWFPNQELEARADMLSSESIVYHRALREPRGFGAVRVHPEDALHIEDALFAAGLKGIIRGEDMHVTIMYDKANPVLDTDAPEGQMNYKTTGQGIDKYGEEGSRWEAIVLKLESPDLAARHNFLLQRGFRHSYPEYRPHLSLKYMPDAGDLDKFKALWESGAFPKTIRFSDEYWEQAQGD